MHLGGGHVGFNARHERARLGHGLPGRRRAQFAQQHKVLVERQRPERLSGRRRGQEGGQRVFGVGGALQRPQHFAFEMPCVRQRLIQRQGCQARSVLQCHHRWTGKRAATIPRTRIKVDEGG